MSVDRHKLLRLAREDGEAVVSICSQDGKLSYLEIGRYTATGHRLAAFAFHRNEVPALRDALGEAKRLMLGAEETSAARRAQELVGLAPAPAPKKARSKKTRRAG